MTTSASETGRLIKADQALHAWVCFDPAPHAAAGGPLAGLRFGVKDVIDVQGLPTRCGSPASSAAPALADAACVAQLRAAGARPMGKTVTAEFAHVSPGPTRNPYLSTHTPGGSSSGSAASVAAQMVDFALGTQTGGSMIRPAAFCGVVGFKPGFGRISRAGMQVMCPSLDVIGWHARDAAMALRVAQVLLPAEPAPARPPSIAVLAEHPGHALSEDARAVLAEAQDRLGAALQVQPRPDSADLLHAHSVIVRVELLRALAPLAQDDRLSPRLRADLAHGQALSEGDYQSALGILHAARERAWEADFGDADLILTTGALGAAPAGLAHTGDSGFNKGWSMLGWPCLHLPTAFNAQGLPLGVMLVARPGADFPLLHWAHALHPLIDQRPH